MKERQLTLRALARELGGIDHSYLSRMLGGKTPVNVRHVERIARHLGLQPDYFAEVREAAVIEAIRARPRLRDAVYFEHVRKSMRNGRSTRTAAR